MPWYNPNLDADLEQELEKRKIRSGTFLDLGTGPGTQAIELAKRGFRVTGTDISAPAIEKAKILFAKPRFIQDDILNSKMKESFDFVFDRGCFHCFDPELRPSYVDHVKNLVKPNGLLFLKCFSVEEEGDWGPHRFREEDIRTIFSPNFHVESIAHSVYQGILDEFPKALFSCLRRK
jgi:SAM-dependent methyltransferase